MGSLFLSKLFLLVPSHPHPPPKLLIQQELEVSEGKTANNIIAESSLFTIHLRTSINATIPTRSKPQSYCSVLSCMVTHHQYQTISSSSLFCLEEWLKIAQKVLLAAFGPLISKGPVSLRICSP